MKPGLRLPRRALLAATATLAAPRILRAQGEVPIRIGEINSYSAVPAFTLPYRSGWQLAVQEINAAGGVLGRQIEVISRDDAGRPENAVRLAGELLDEQKVDLLAGGFLSNVGLAISDVAARRKRLYVAGEPLTDALVWDKGNRYCFRLRPSTYMQAAMLVRDAVKLPGKRWATVAPNYEYGTSSVKWFQQLLTAQRPDVTFVAAQWPALGKIDAGATVAALEEAKPDAIFNVTFGADLTNFVRQGNTRGLFEDRTVVSALTGEPEYLMPLGDERPEGWLVTGYPWDQIDTPDNTRFVVAYQTFAKVPPMMGSVVGYTLLHAIATGITKAGKTETEAMVDAFKGLTFASPFGPAQFRAIDHQSTLGTFVGRTSIKSVMTDWHYDDGADFLPDDATVRKLRPAMD